MRITNSMVISDYVRNLNKNTSKIGNLQNQISSGKKISKASDDPIGASKAMEIRTNLSKIGQYSRNVTESKELLSQSETSLNEMNSLLSRAYELNIEAANGTNSQLDKNAVANEIEQISQQLIVSANTTFSGRYVFGGENATTAPFEVKDVDGKNVLFYNGKNLNTLADPDLTIMKSERQNYQIGFGSNMDVSYTGIDVMGNGENNIFGVLNNLKDALKSGDNDTVQKSIGFLKNKQNDILSTISEIGGKNNRLDMFETRIESDEFNYKNMLENTEGIDIAKVITDLQAQQTSYEAALSSGSKIIMPTLADFIK